MRRIERPRHIEAQDPEFATLKRRLQFMWLAGTAITVISLPFLGVLSILIGVIAMGWLLLQTQLELWHKAQVEHFHHYRAVESLMSLHALLDIRQPLPSMRLWVISPDFATLMVSLIRRHRPQTIVELGSGTSTIISSYSLEANGAGQVISFEHLERFVESSRANLARHDLDSWATVRHAPLTEVNVSGGDWQWYDSAQMADIESIDLLIVDGPPEDVDALARYPAMPVFYERLSKGALILVDDVGRGDETAMINRWLDEYDDLEMVEVIANEKGAAILRKR